MRTLRHHIERRTGHGWRLRRLRERVLKAARRLPRAGRRLVVILERCAAGYGQNLFESPQRRPLAPA